MKLQKRFLREHKGKNYYKYVVNLPPKSVEQASLKEGDKLEAQVTKKGILLKKK